MGPTLLRRPAGRSGGRTDGRCGGRATRSSGARTVGRAVGRSGDRADSRAVDCAVERSGGRSVGRVGRAVGQTRSQSRSGTHSLHRHSARTRDAQSRQTQVTHSGPTFEALSRCTSLRARRPEARQDPRQASFAVRGNASCDHIIPGPSLDRLLHLAQSSCAERGPEVQPAVLGSFLLGGRWPALSVSAGRVAVGVAWIGRVLAVGRAAP